MRESEGGGPAAADQDRPMRWCVAARSGCWRWARSTEGHCRPRTTIIHSLGGQQQRPATLQLLERFRIDRLTYGGAGG